MTKAVFDKEAYYKVLVCAKCRGPVSKKQMAKCKKEGFIKTDEKCYNELKASLAKCQPLMQKLAQR